MRLIFKLIRSVLPKRFIKIRHYCFLSTRSKKVDLPRIRALLGVAIPEKAPQLTARVVLLKTTGVDPWLCPKYKTDSMRVIEIIPSIRGAPNRTFSIVTPMTVHEIKKQDLQEQREIREAIREEEKARRDFERVRPEAESEEKILEKARK